MTSARAQLLIVDDDAAHMRALASTLELEGYVPSGFTCAREALESMKRQSFDLVLTDLSMPDMDGIQFTRAAQAIDPQVVCIVMTGHGSIDTAVAAMRAGALDYILKPFTLRMITPVLERALTVRRLRRENVHLRRTEEAVRAVNIDLEHSVAERTRQLQDANAELEAFSHSVSHDLRTPLRAVNAFAQMLAAEYAPVLDQRGRGYIERVLSSVERMENLIEDLMRLSQVNAMETRLADVDLSQLAASVIDDLRSHDPQRQVETAIAPALRCRADPRLLRIALENLIGNAWKFTSRAEHPRIEIGAEHGHGHEQGVARYYVRDNGAGFDNRYATGMFSPFRRLHSESDFPGTGVGLSIVQRIIRRHGGTIVAEGAIGRGATFHFTLPDTARPASTRQTG